MSSECLRAKSLQMSPTLWDPINCSPRGSSVCEILQARILEWVAMPSSRGSSWPRDQICISYVSCIGRRVVYPQHHLGSRRHPVAGDYPKSRAWAVCIAVNRLMWPWPTRKFHIILTSGSIIYLNRCLHITGSYICFSVTFYLTHRFLVYLRSISSWSKVCSITSQQVTSKYMRLGLPWQSGGWDFAFQCRRLGFNPWWESFPHSLKPKLTKYKTETVL